MTNLDFDSQNRLDWNVAVAFALAAGLLLAPHPLRAQTLSTIYSFCSQLGCTDGDLPYASVVQGSDGNFYGTTSGGGANGNGTVFKITPSGTLTTLYSFCSQNDCADGNDPYAGLVQGSDGNFYGTTLGGGANSSNPYGTVFKITPGGTLTTLYSFCSQNDCTDGSVPYGGLVQGSDSNFFYGTTFGGGANGYGTVFKITPSGALTTIYSFCAQTSCTDGGEPFAEQLQGSDGNFYGTTSGGGANGQGTVFKITPSGTLSTVYNFCSQGGCTDGSDPAAGVVQGSDGNFYGTTLQGGANGNYGTVFKLTPDGILTTLYSFCAQSACTDGDGPYAGVVQGSDGNFYGTTFNGGTNGEGTIFKITSGGMLTTLYNFCAQSGCADGANPFAAPVQGSDGNFYGTTYEGGTNEIFPGTVYKLGVFPFGMLSSASLTFPTQAVNTLSGAQTVTVTNTGLGSLSISNVTINGADPGDFSQNNDCVGSLAAGDNCVISVTFFPTAGGPLTATLTITDNNSNVAGTTETVDLSGMGAGGLAVSLSSSSLTFAAQTAGTSSSAQTVTLTNTGNAPLNILGISTGGYFSQTNTCGTSLGAGANCVIAVTFTPLGPGTTTGTLTIFDNAAGSPQTVVLSGTGIVFTSGPNPPVVEPPPTTPQPGEPANPPVASGEGSSGPRDGPGREITPSHTDLAPAPTSTTVAPAAVSSAPAARFSSSALTFPTQTVGTRSDAQTITVNNSSDAPMAISSITASQDFSQTNDCGDSVAAGDSCTINVSFKPTASGARSGTLTIQGGAPGNTQTVTLSGPGEPPVRLSGLAILPLRDLSLPILRETDSN